MAPDWQQWLTETLAARDDARLRRRLQAIDSPQGPRVRRDGRWLHNFCSNDYLGLAAEPALAEALRDAVTRVGVGAGAAGLVCGHHHEHAALAAELADWLGEEAVLLFGNGYLANLGILQALVGKGDRILQDRLDHASLIDGALASGAAHERYAHGDAADLARRLAAATARRTLIVSDGVFSMDGDLAPLPALADLAERHHALLMLDEAHAFGVLGAGGRGSVSHWGLAPGRVPLRMGTLGKAFGVYGAFVAGPRLLIDVLQQLARPAIYTTALPPALAAATRAALVHVRDDDWRRDALQARIAQLRAGLAAQGWSLMPSPTAIQPVLLGDAARALALSEALVERGFLAGAIRPPTVPAGTARLRFTVTATHTAEAVDALLAVLADLAPRFLESA